MRRVALILFFYRCDGLGDGVVFSSIGYPIAVGRILDTFNTQHLVCPLSKST